MSCQAGRGSNVADKNVDRKNKAIVTKVKKWAYSIFVSYKTRYLG